MLLRGKKGVLCIVSLEMIIEGYETLNMGGDWEETQLETVGRLEAL